jgi:hypothetical protein
MSYQYDRLTSSNKRRSNWHVSFNLVDDRAIGVVYEGVIYPVPGEDSRLFNVKTFVGPKGVCFNIGFGSSGCKVPFIVPN